MSASIPALKRNLFLQLCALLSVLAALVLYSHYTVIQVIRQGRQEVEIVNATGRQRMLAQQFVRQANLALVGMSLSDWEALLEQRRLSAETAARFEQTMQALLHGGQARLGEASVDLPHVTTPELHARLVEVAALWAEVKRASIKVLRSDTTKLRDHPDLALMQTRASQLVAKVDETLLLMQQRESRRADQLLRYQTAMLVGGLLTFVLLATFVYGKIIAPLADTIRRFDIQRVAREQAQAELAEVHRQFLKTSHQAGMAEVASSVLHNVGNVLNSVNISVGIASEKAAKFRAASLVRVAALLREHAGDLPAFFEKNPQGAQLPTFLSQLSEHFSTGQETLCRELDSLKVHVEHINEIVAMQQSYAGVGGLIENLSFAELIEDALQMNAASLQRHGVRLVCEVDPHLPRVDTDRHKILLILTNLIRNAKNACSESAQVDKYITLTARLRDPQRVEISVRDNGIGIPPENLQRIFAHGFTTRKDGHGFGLHSSALAAKQLGGALHVQSDGTNCGATFTLDLAISPIKKPALSVA